MKGVKILSNPAYFDISEFKGKRILVVDDNQTNLKILEDQLKGWRFTPSMAGSGEQALDILSNNSSFDLTAIFSLQNKK